MNSSPSSSTLPQVRDLSNAEIVEQRRDVLARLKDFLPADKFARLHIPPGTDI